MGSSTIFADVMSAKNIIYMRKFYLFYLPCVQNFIGFSARYFFFFEYKNQIIAGEKKYF